MTDRQCKSYHTLKSSVKRSFHSPSLPLGHRFYQDCLREISARWIDWAVKVLPEEDTWFVTMTFRRDETSRSALVYCNHWIGRLRQAYTFKFSYRIRWIRAMALQARGVIHFHLLICGKDLNLLSRKSWERRWETMDWNTGTCRIYNSDNEKTAEYLAREISKEGELTWGGNWQGLKTPESVRCCGERSNIAALRMYRQNDTRSEGHSVESVAFPKSITLAVE